MRTLTAAISASCDTASMDAVYVVEIKRDSVVLGRWSTYSALADWDGTDADAVGLIETVPEIRQDIDWRGGLGHYSEPTFDLSDPDGTLAGALRSSMNLDIEVWFLLVSGTISKSTQAIRIYRGVVGGYEAKGSKITISAADRRIRRYPSHVLSKIDTSNTANFCGAGRKQSDVGVWDLDTWAYEDKWMNDDIKGDLVPLVFGKPQRVKVALVSTWPGGQDIEDTESIRGPILVVSDCKYDYGTSPTILLDRIFRVDQDTGESFDLSGYNDVPALVFYDRNLPAASFCSSEDPNNAWRATKSFNTYARLSPLREAWRANPVVGDWSSMAGKIEDATNCLRMPGGIVEYTTEYPLFLASFTGSSVPAGAGLVRGAYYEIYANNVGAAFYGTRRLKVALSRDPDWGGYDSPYLTKIILLSSDRQVFNNWAWGTGSNTWAEAAVEHYGSAPFEVGHSIGPKDISGFMNQLILVTLDDMDHFGDQTGMDVRVYGAFLVVCVDFGLEENYDRLGCAVRDSFDSVYWDETGNFANCSAWQTIYATLAKIFAADEDDDIEDDSEWISSSSGVPTETSRLDFQLYDDMSGRDLLDEMAMQSGLWIVASDDGKEKPVFVERRRGRGSEYALSADFDSTNIVKGSFAVTVGDEEDLFNQFRVRYSRDMFGTGYFKEVYVDETGGNCEDTNINDVVSGWCAASQSAYGVTRELVIEAWMIEDADSAEKLLMVEASKLCRRPQLCSFTTSLTGIRWEIGDFPIVAHPTFLAHCTKGSGTGDLSAVLLGQYGFFLAGENGIETGDWVYATSAALISDELDGWYRITNVVPTTFPDDGYYLWVDVPGGTSGTYADCTLTVTPAMMITGYGIRGAEIDIDLTEIAHRAQ